MELSVGVAVRHYSHGSRGSQNDPADIANRSVIRRRTRDNCITVLFSSFLIVRTFCFFFLDTPIFLYTYIYYYPLHFKL
jgi:hypothetical protein